MATTYDKIATTTLSSPATTITFSSIPATYTDLRIVYVGAHNGTAGGVLMTLNNDTSALYSGTQLYGTGSAAGSSRYSAANSWQFSTGFFLNSQPGLISLDLFSYAGSTFKTALIQANLEGDSPRLGRDVALYRSTSAINRIDFDIASQAATGTTVTLYGILKA
jgi:hypothetical protein